MRNMITFSLCAALAACTSSTSSDDFSDLATLSAKSDAFSSKMKIVGSITPGASKDVIYHNPAKYRALTFAAKAGDQVGFTLDSADGSSIAWVLDNKFKTVIRSEDQDPGVNHFEFSIPRSASYYLVLRDASFQDATFTVSMDNSASCSAVCNEACVVGSSCQADSNGCMSCQPEPACSPVCDEACVVGSSCRADSNGCMSCRPDNTCSSVCTEACVVGESCKADANGCVACRP